MKSNTEDQETLARCASQRRVAPAPSPLASVFAFSARAAGAALVIASAASPAWAADSLVLEPNPPLLLGLIVGFAVLIFPANQLIFKPIFQALDEREARIAGARSRAGQIQSEADRVLNDYQTRIREARADGDAARKEQITAARGEQSAMTASARSEAETQIEQARATLVGDLESAREQMRTHAQELARSAAEQILGRSL